MIFLHVLQQCQMLEKSRFVPEVIANAKFSLTGHDILSGHGTCSRLLEGITNELFPSTSESF